MYQILPYKYICTHLIFTTLCHQYYYFHVKDEETHAEKLTKQEVTDLNPSNLAPESTCLTTVLEFLLMMLAKILITTLEVTRT